MASPDAATLFRVPGLVAVITGGATGLGLMMAKALASNGASSVYIIGRRLDRLSAAASFSPSVIKPIVGDVTSKASLASIAQRIASEVGHIDLLVCNSGVGGPAMSDIPKDASLKQFRDAVWEKWSMEDFAGTYATNISAVFFTAVAFLELLDAGNKREREGGMRGVASQIVITGSIAAYIRVVVSGFAYVSSKAGVTQMAKALSTFLAPHGIRVNTLAPGCEYCVPLGKVFDGGGGDADARI